VKDWFALLAFDAAPGTPVEFLDLLRSEYVRWEQVAMETRIQLD